MQLQRSIGNQAVQRLINTPYIQTKLQVSTPGDPYEQEADRVADTVMRMPASAKTPTTRTPRITPLVQREIEPPDEDDKEETLQTAPPIQRQMDEEDQGEVQTKLLSSQLSRTPCASPGSAHVVQRLCKECEGEKEREEQSGGMVQRQSAPEQVSDDDDAEEQVQSKATQSAGPAVATSVANNIRAMNGGGSPLSNTTRAFFEPRFGVDFSQVRVHTDARAADTSSSINAKAFTVGPNIAFGAGRYAPQSREGQQLLAHELTHIVQQGAASTRLNTVQRQEEILDEPVFEPSEAKLEEMEDEGEAVGQQGVVEPDEGTYLWPEPDPGKDQKMIALLPMNTRVFVDRKVESGRYSVYVEKHQRGEALPVPEDTHGYVGPGRVNTDMPDPDAWFFKIKKGGQGALALAGEVYKDNFKASWGKDYRYLVNVLSFINDSKGRKYITKKNPNDAWDEAETKLGGKIWVPGLELVDALHGQISSGSITYEVLTTLADIGIGIAAFIVGLLHGALMSIADIFIGIYDLIKMIGDLVVKLFKGTLISDAKAFFEEISNIKISDIIDMVGAKWNAPSTWDRWKFRGYVIGYAIVEILLLIFSVGAVTAVKWVGKIGKFAKLAEYLSKLPKIQKIISAAKALKGKAIDKIQAAMKAAAAFSEAHVWASAALRLPMNILNRLTEVDIGKLKKLPQWARERFAHLSDAFKLRYLGCTSPCKVNVREIEEALSLATKAGRIGRKLISPDDVLAVLKRLNPNLKTAKISRKLRKKNSALMIAIHKADITDVDFEKLAAYLTPADYANPKAAYDTFVRYLTGVVPAKAGGGEAGIKKLNEIAEALVDAKTTRDFRRGAALKGSMFEQWVALHVPELASKDFTKKTFDLVKLFNRKTPPFTRAVDKWAANEVWEFKHQFSKVPDDQAKDLAELLRAPKAGVSPDEVVKNVNYLFPSKAYAELNRHLATTYGFVVHYVDEAGVLTRLK